MILLYPQVKFYPPPQHGVPLAFVKFFLLPKLGKFQKSSTPQLKLGGTNYAFLILLQK